MNIAQENLGTRRRAKAPWTVRARAELSRNKYLYLLALPVLLYYLIFQYGPMFGLVIAFKQYNVGQSIWESQWVGLKYFKEFFSGLYFCARYGTRS